MILAIRIQAQDGTLHDVTLPKSWLVRLLPKIDILRSTARQLSRLYKNNMGELLEQIYSGDGACQYGSSAAVVHCIDIYDSVLAFRGSGTVYFAASEQEHILREGVRASALLCRYLRSFIDRCKNLCLCELPIRVRSLSTIDCTTPGGYNTRSFELRNDITRAITAVRKPGRTYSSLIDEYVACKRKHPRGTRTDFDVATSMQDIGITSPRQFGTLRRVRRWTR